MIYNHKRLQDLPDFSEDHPHLTKHIFSDQLPLKDPYQRGVYKHHIIPFGMSLKVDQNDWSFDKIWLRKFEKHILKKMVWVSVIVNFEHEVLGHKRYIYDSKPDSLRDVIYEVSEIGDIIESELRWSVQAQMIN
jgi:hypothetical protein